MRLFTQGVSSYETMKRTVNDKESMRLMVPMDGQILGNNHQYNTIININTNTNTTSV